MMVHNTVLYKIPFVDARGVDHLIVQPNSTHGNTSGAVRVLQPNIPVVAIRFAPNNDNTAAAQVNESTCYSFFAQIFSDYVCRIPFTDAAEIEYHTGALKKNRLFRLIQNDIFISDQAQFPLQILWIRHMFSTVANIPQID
ncbi:hypothetical protein D3C73_786490 [compost metagenome]